MTTEKLPPLDQVTLRIVEPSGAKYVPYIHRSVWVKPNGTMLDSDGNQTSLTREEWGLIEECDPSLPPYVRNAIVASQAIRNDPWRGR